MWLTHRNKRCLELDPRVFKRLFGYYPEEELLSRKIPKEALANGTIKKTDLQREANTLFIPWQMFMLNWENLQQQLRKIETNRKDKIRIAQLSRRAAQGGATPNRLIDRYIRAQNFLASTAVYGPNPYNGLLRGKTVSESVEATVAQFSIDRPTFWGKTTKDRALDYLIDRVQSGQVNVALGTSEARLAPSSRNHRSLYKNISGFCLRDANVPFVFVNMNMADEEEPVGRRIYTLVYLLVLVGLGIYTVTRDWRPDHTASGVGDPYLKLAHDITSEFLCPASSLDPYRGQKITVEIVRELSDQYKITPTAMIFRLWKEHCITAEEREALKQPPVLRKSRSSRSPHIENAVRKFNGGLVFGAVNSTFSSHRITQNQAQYILFGRIRRTAWRQYRTRLGI